MISFGHAKVILSLSDAQRQVTFCEQIIKKGLSVRQAEATLTTRLRASAPRKGQSKDIHIRDLEQKLERHLGTRVRLRHGRKRGKIQIDYYSLEDLDRVLKLLGIRERG